MRGCLSSAGTFVLGAALNILFATQFSSLQQDQLAAWRVAMWLGVAVSGACFLGGIYFICKSKSAIQKIKDTTEF